MNIETKHDIGTLTITPDDWSALASKIKGTRNRYYMGSALLEELDAISCVLQDMPNCNTASASILADYVKNGIFGIVASFLGMETGQTEEGGAK